MYHTITKGNDTRNVKSRYLQGFLDRGWTEVKKNSSRAKKDQPSVELKATKTEAAEWDINVEDWADSEESMSDNRGDE